MNIIIPYDNKIEATNGAFIKPDGDIIYVDTNHEDFAYNYCCKSNSLKKENLLLFKRWLMSHKSINRGMFSDFMTLVIGFDKIECVNE